MRFIALVQKEFRESLPWMLLAAIAILSIGGLNLYSDVYFQGFDYNRSQFTPGSTVEYYQLTRYSSLNDPGIALFIVSIGLGICIGIRQFWVPSFTKEWGYLIHRSVNRKEILLAKLITAVLAFIISPGIIWVILYNYSTRPELFVPPAIPKFFIIGWIFIAIGFITYLGVALSGISRAKWYSTKIFGCAFAFLVIVSICWQFTLLSAFVIIFIGIIILLSQIMYTFLCREF